ncbi:uncharacterized protein DKFZp434B061-like [Meriones unguiculatus]|uniref:uncharacterized protein DKFZp434B061-like n=1 Tax=Meriones unguiculatus TaxID=10047 RepID=UPI00293E22BB|nr:uncharacterized protein DKFZp434B061-like [Meriones unguiculatus]
MQSPQNASENQGGPSPNGVPRHASGLGKRSDPSPSEVPPAHFRSDRKARSVPLSVPRDASRSAPRPGRRESPGTFGTLRSRLPTRRIPSNGPRRFHAPERPPRPRPWARDNGSGAQARRRGDSPRGRRTRGPENPSVPTRRETLLSRRRAPPAARARASASLPASEVDAGRAGPGETDVFGWSPPGEGSGSSDFRRRAEVGVFSV